MDAVQRRIMEMIRHNDKWDKRFMGLARDVALWSKDPSSKCGAVLVDDRRRVAGVGFNGFAAGADDHPSLYEDREYKLANVIHAEENALFNSTVNPFGLHLFTTAAPCASCVARIIQVGVVIVTIPCLTEDPFARREGHPRKLDHAAAQFGRAQVNFRMMKQTGFNPKELMGVENPSTSRGEGSNYMGMHTLNCDEYHAHDAPACCAPQCPCMPI